MQTDAPLTDTTFATFTPSTKHDKSLPVLLFQSGYGSTPAAHEPLMQKIADSGYVCVIPAREGDKQGGHESVGKLFTEFLPEGKPACGLNALSTDGSHLAAALAWAKARKEVNGQPIDTTNMAGAGFSMGAVEAIQFAAACAADLKAVILISPSTGEMVEKIYKFSRADLVKKCSEFPFPSLWITSDKDAMLQEAKDLYTAAAAPASMVSFKDEVLDNSMKHSEKHSIWTIAINDMMPGIAQHFALATEEGVVSDAPVISFLNQHLKGAASPFAPEAAIAECTSK